MGMMLRGHTNRELADARIRKESGSCRPRRDVTDFIVTSVVCRIRHARDDFDETGPTAGKVLVDVFA